MDILEVIALNTLQDLTDEQKEEAYKTLLTLEESTDDYSKKSLRKTLKLCLSVLRHKGEQVTQLHNKLKTKSQADSPDDLRIDQIAEENQKLKGMLAKVESEKNVLKEKIKEMNDEILHMQKRPQESVQIADSSDKESSDPLSELDRQEELLRSINSKNKHIKRLLREIETLQTQNIEQSKTIIVLEKRAQQSKADILELSANVTLVDSERKALQETITELNVKIVRLEENVTYLEDERERSERDIKDFIEKIELKAKSWRSIIDAKDVELEKLREKAEAFHGENQPTSAAPNQDKEKVEKENNNTESTIILQHSVEERDKLINKLESKIKIMAEEMIASTKLMNRFSAERESDQRSDSQKTRECCQITAESLHAVNDRCRELSEMLERSEEDNQLKSKQAMQAITALDAYQRGEDGLMRSLRKCSSLEQKLQSREKQIRNLVVELNSMHEISNENILLRRKLNIPADAIIATRNIAARERNKDKMMERLTLKLRASEEIRLQMKLEKIDLRKQLIELQRQLDQQHEGQLNTVQVRNEVGEVESSSQEGVDRLVPTPLKSVSFCEKCQQSYRLPQNQFDKTAQEITNEWEAKYSDVIVENENLRVGMHEILDKIREYDETSDHITIDCELLNRLLHALDARSRHDPAVRMQNELFALRERELALREQIYFAEKKNRAEDDDDSPASSIESMREAGEICDDDDLMVPFSPSTVRPLFDSSTRPTTPNKDIDQSLFPVILPQEPHELEKIIERNRSFQEQLTELQVYRDQFIELKAHFNDSEEEIRRYCSSLVEKVSDLELKFAAKCKAYDFLREDLERSLTEAKQRETGNINIIADLKTRLSQKSQDNAALQSQCDAQADRTANTHTDEEFINMQKNYNQLQAQMAYIVENIFSSKVPQALLEETEICCDYGIIQENLQLDFVPAEEYERQRKEFSEAVNREISLQTKCTQLEALLGIAQEQVHSQQTLLNDITDNHISLRHLVADLQSSTEDKFLIAKIQRDLDSAKFEISNLQSSRDKLQLKCEALELEINAKEKESANLTKSFHNQCRNNEIKLKFLQKSLLAMREKYSKFTPLIFLTNFVYAYTKFIKRSSDADAASADNLQERLDILISSKLSATTAASESDDLIKLIKCETKCNLLEQQLKGLQQKYESLQEELNEERLASATENEHWKTIDALFGSGSTEMPAVAAAIVASDKKDKGKILQDGMNVDGFQVADASTNTEPATPVPAERMASGISRKQKVSIEMIDKKLSPIGSPIKVLQSGKEFTSSFTQTDKGITTLPIAPVAAKESCQTSPLVSPRKTDTFAQTERQARVDDHSMQTSPVDSPSKDTDSLKVTLENQLAQAIQLAETRNELLVKGEEDLAEAKKRIKELEKSIKALKTTQKGQEKNVEDKPIPQQDENQQAGIIEKTILSFHTLLSEKDKSIHKYQDLLQSEREQTQKTIINLNADIDSLKSTVTNLNFNIKTKDMEILELKTQLESISVRRNSREKIDIAIVGAGDGGDNSLHEISDEKIEEMFQDEGQSSTLAVPIAQQVVQQQSDRGGVPSINSSEYGEEKDNDKLKEIPALQKQIKDLNVKVMQWKKLLKDKEEQIIILKEKINLYHEREKTIESNANPEVEQLRQLLDEKDKHINDLMETLSNFHDDQQRFLDDSSNSSADQISKLASNLQRFEATNKIYQTQVEALRRQVTSLTQREKQARELNQSLRNQLIKRPVVSIKTELNTRVKNENLQKRIAALELELEENRSQLRRQQILIEAKRAKSASEVGLWEKQKRWQQNAEKFKAKLEDTECALDKTKSLLQTARNTIARLEKDKQVLEVKLGRASNGQVQASNVMKCCRTPSCPNLHQIHQGGGKYTPSESPEGYTGASSECSSPARGAIGGRNVANGATSASLHFYTDGDHGHREDLIDALKARNELQQRRIITLELERKGSNALTTELEKMQENFSLLEAQNIRLEAKNLQLQLDNDMLRQGDTADRMQKRVKHLEDYIIALKEELAQAEVRREYNMKSIGKDCQVDQTILSLKRIVEKLRAENKYLKDGRRSCESRSTATDSPTELSRLQQMYTESLDKISALQIELNLKAKCINCGSRGKIETHSNDDLRFIQEQLLKKTQLLQKAKVLLTRAAAKEKVLKEQLALWKRKCSELQNVPVIDEISE